MAKERLLKSILALEGSESNWKPSKILFTGVSTLTDNMSRIYNKARTILKGGG
jgi:hypothetical protein